MTPDEIARYVQEHREKALEYRQKALEHFPLELIETTGDQALAKWQELKSDGRGSPVVLGADDERHSFENLLTPFGPNLPQIPPPRPVEDIVRAAVDITFPDDLAKSKKALAEAARGQFKARLAADPEMPLPQIIDTNSGEVRAYSREEMIAAMEQEPHEPPLGEWPASPGPSTGLSIVDDFRTGKPFAKVYIGLAPTDDWTTIPAWLRWGGWNACPAAEYHVAAMRTWRDRYGAELIGMSSDTINLRVAAKPKTRDEALALARDQYVYCNDIIDQGYPNYSTLAADLMANDWWYFWWD